MNDHAPLIGLTTYGREPQQGLPRFSLPSDYVDAVRRAGGHAVLLPPGTNAARDLLARLDGVILTGGGDVEPHLYGADHHATIYSVDRERDASEIALATEILDGGVPTLAICRGMQVLAVALGGTLHPHLPDVVGESVLHRVPPRDPTPHVVHVTPGSRLAAVLGSTEVVAESWHHQGLAEIPPGLSVVAHAPDEVVEAVETTSPDRWLFGVQWHPELSAATQPPHQRLFDGLVDAARQGRRS